MPVNLTAPDPLSLHAVPGVRIGVAMAGVRKANRRDLVLFALDEGAPWPASSPATASAPRRCSCAASIWPPGRGIRALLVNTGNANAGTGADGLARAAAQLRGAGRAAGRCSAQQVLPFSTGVIMETLPVERIEAACRPLWPRCGRPTAPPGPRPRKAS